MLVQGRARIDERPDRQYLEEVLGPRAEQFLGKPRRGLFWDRWLREYYMDRVPIHVTVDRVVDWPDRRCEGVPVVTGTPLARPAPSQHPPAKGTGPRVHPGNVRRRLAGLPYRLLATVGADGYPVVIPVELGAARPEGVQLRAAAGLLPPGERRAGLLGHDHRPKLVGLESRVDTGWLQAVGDGGLYAAHSRSGFLAPPNKTLLFFTGLLAKRGVRQAATGPGPASRSRGQT